MTLLQSLRKQDRQLSEQFRRLSDQGKSTILAHRSHVSVKAQIIKIELQRAAERRKRRVA